MQPGTNEETEEETEIEVWWDQTGPEQWQAVLEDRKTAHRYVVHSRAELQEVLERILAD